MTRPQLETEGFGLAMLEAVAEAGMEPVGAGAPLASVQYVKVVTASLC